MKKVDLPSGYEVVNSDELAGLRRKARSHDAYLWATRAMADKARVISVDSHPFDAWAMGYRTSLTDFARFVVDAPIPD